MKVYIMNYLPTIKKWYDAMQWSIMWCKTLQFQLLYSLLLTFMRYMFLILDMNHFYHIPYTIWLWQSSWPYHSNPQDPFHLTTLMILLLWQPLRPFSLHNHMTHFLWQPPWPFPSNNPFRPFYSFYLQDPFPLIALRICFSW